MTHPTQSSQAAVLSTTQLAIIGGCSALLIDILIVFNGKLFGTIWGTPITSHPALSAHAVLRACFAPDLARYALLAMLNNSYPSMPHMQCIDTY
jgi:hypothetical protein